MKPFFAALLFTAACGSASAPAPILAGPTPVSTPAPSSPTATPPSTASTSAVHPSGAAPPAHAEIGSWGFDRTGMDLATAPGDDFYTYANGAWQARTTIPDDKAGYGVSGELGERSIERTKELILGAHGEPGTEERKIADCYQSFMDEAAIEVKGIRPIQADLDRIAAIKNPSGIVAAFADNIRHQRTSPIGLHVVQDMKDPETYIVMLIQGGLGLPDREFYDVTAKQFEKQREGYKKYLEDLLTAIGEPNATQRAASVYALEEKIAKAHWTHMQMRNRQKSYNKLAIADVKKLAPGFPWNDWLADLGVAGVTAIDVMAPSAIASAAKLVTSEPVAVWRDYLTLHLLSDTAPLLAKKFVDLKFERDKTLSGTPALEERSRRGVELVIGALPQAVGKLYVAKYFAPETKRHAEEFVHNLVAAMRRRIEAATWMAPETKAKALEKVATYHTKIGYPEHWRDYSGLDIRPDDVVGNAARAAAFEYDHDLAKLGKPIDRDEWAMTPMTVDAMAEFPNDIVLPAALFQPPFFDPHADDAINYGGVGAVIGHEISHFFDDLGSQVDAHGKLSNWWTKADAARYKAATAKLAAQYATYCPVPANGDKPAQCVNGERTIGENIADLSGVTIAYDAYKQSLGGKPAPLFDGLTGDQRFFLGFAQVWRSKIRDAAAANRLVTDAHSPAVYRVATVRNLDAWYDAFKPAPTDKLYLAPEDRVRLW